MKIAICDDDSAYVKKIESVVRTTLAEKNIDARFDLISDSAQLHDSAETYDMAFLDIAMTSSLSARRKAAQSGSRKSAEAHRQDAHKLSCERERKSRVCLLKRYCFC